MAEITYNGYVLKNQNTWYAEEQQLYLDIDPNWNLDPSSPDGLKLASDAEIFANLDELAQKAYNSKDPNKAKDVDLNILCSLTGTTRSEGTPSSVTLTLTGVNGTVVQAGKIVESVSDGSQWTIDSDVTITGGTATATATCTTNGATPASIGTITKIVNTVGGWQSVTNPTVATLGTNRQSDSLLRVERRRSVARPGNNQLDSITGELFDVEGVRRVRVYENYTSVTDENGLTQHSVAPIIDGGADADIAKAIFIKKNPGCDLYIAGTPVTVEGVYDRYPNNATTITFSRPIYVDMMLIINITDDGSLPVDVEDLIKAAIIDYTQGSLIDSEVGFNSTGFDIGDNVPVRRLDTPINQVIGQYGNAFINTMSVNGYTSGVVPIEFNELTRWSEDNITVILS
ncbi:MAG: putative baseplate protein J [Prokaryotic dsDNA virus sp.]|nr:MAG: putative baseplate protein J [Prokaryotic dsDNA virus sp.]|tara:strand:- start:12299 stop:13498 length:1200 start_codon:yes stop_codon:yes gene_type:complete